MINNENEKKKNIDQSRIRPANRKNCTRRFKIIKLQQVEKSLRDHGKF